MTQPQEAFYFNVRFYGFSSEHPCFFGAGGGTRTHTMSPSTDFESVTSANSITPAYISPPLRTTDILYHSFMEKSSTPEEFLGGFS